MTRFTSLLILVLVGLFFAMAPSVWALGDVGSPECGAAQEACLDAIDPDELKNHGKKVSDCALASSAEAGFDITDECHSCIVHQIARGIPIGERENCGSDDPCLDCPCKYFDVEPDAQCWPVATVHIISGSNLCAIINTTDFPPDGELSVRRISSILGVRCEITHDFCTQATGSVSLPLTSEEVTPCIECLDLYAAALGLTPVSDGCNLP